MPQQSRNPLWQNHRSGLKRIPGCRRQRITEASRAKLAKIGKIFPKLGWLNASGFRQSRRRNRLNPILVESFNNPEIEGEPIDGLLGDDKLRHM